jgi:hypothetical protein
MDVKPLDAAIAAHLKALKAEVEPEYVFASRINFILLQARDRGDTDSELEAALTKELYPLIAKAMEPRE